MAMHLSSVKSGNAYLAGLLAGLIALCASCNFQPKQAGQNGEGTSDGAAPVDSLLAAINQRIEGDPNNFAHYLERARYYGDRDKYADAFRDIDRALKLDSTQSTILLLKGELHWELQDVNSAYDSYKSCIALNPEEIPCLLKKAAIDITLHNFDVALGHLNTVLKKDELLAEPYYLKGRLYKEAGDTTLSASSYQTAIERDPNYYDAYIEVGLLYAKRKHDLAREYYNTAIEIRPQSIEAWYNKAMFLQETGFKQKSRYDEAFSCYDSILAIDGNFAPAWFNKGFICLEYLSDYKKGADYFTEAIRLNPQYYQAYYNRGLCRESLSMKKEAESDYRQALALSPQYTDAAKSLSRVLGE